MSEKIILTVEQEKSLNGFKMRNMGIEEFLGIKGMWAKELSPLKTVTVEEMARILYEPNSYVVDQPKFKKDDRVVFKNGHKFEHGGKVATIVRKEDGYWWLDTGKMVTEESIRLETTEEAFWAQLGREVGEFKIGDATLTVNDTAYFLENDEDVLDEKDEYNNGRLKGFYPAESFIKIPL